jgi:phi13 family phage major tail protein
MAEKIIGKIGLSNLHFTKEKIEGVFDSLKFPFAVEAEFEKETEEVVEYADDIVVYQASIATKGEVTLKVKDFPTDAYLFLYGTVKTDEGVIIDNVNDVSGEVSIMYRETLTSGYYRFVCIPRCTGSKPKSTASTKADKIAITDEELKFTATPIENGDIAYYFTTNDLESAVAKNWFLQPFKRPELGRKK